MQTRTIKVLGWGEGSSGSAKITAELDGTTVFSGTVNLVELTKHNESEKTAPTLFSFELPMEFTGTKHMKVIVADATVRFAYIVGNYTQITNFLGMTNASSGPNDYADVSIETDYVRDARSNVTIDGIKQTPNRSLGRGAWHWVVKSGSTLEHDLTVSPSAE